MLDNPSLWNDFKASLTGTISAPTNSATTDYGLATVTASVLNVRENPSTDAAIIGKKNNGDEVRIGFLQGNWPIFILVIMAVG